MLRCQTYQDGVRSKTESWQREKVRDMRRSGFTIGFSDVFYTLSLDVGRVQERRLSDPSLT